VHKYTAFYCEENIWHLAKARSHGSVLFISNAVRKVACFAQKRAQTLHLPMVWDYHVVWLDGVGSSATVWDFDSVLKLGTAARTYLEATFRSTDPTFAPRFRRIPRDEFLATFCSNRRHMRSSDGTFAEPEPAWPCIGEGSNLETFIDMNKDGPGTVCSLSDLLTGD
jgi:protein N-terminal glutamine amidohydrolase